MRNFLNVLLVILFMALICGMAFASVLSSAQIDVSQGISTADDAVLENVTSSCAEPSSVSFTSVSYDVGIVGRETTIWANVLPPEASFDNWIISFNTADADIANVSRDLISEDRISAIVTGISPGFTSIDIRITSVDGVTSFDASCRVYVWTVPVASVSLNVQEKTVYEGYTHTLTAIVLPDNATDKTLEWRSSSDDIVSISHSGAIKCLKAGKATITVSAGGKYDMCRFIVKASPVWLTESDAVKFLPAGASFDVVDGTIVWSGLGGAYDDWKTIIKNEDLYGYHIVGFYGYEEREEFKYGWRARIRNSSSVEVEFDRNEEEVNAEIGIIIISNGAGYMTGADIEKHITVKFSGKNENKDKTGCNSGIEFLALAIVIAGTAILIRYVEC
jgi:uncharacterized protein YjdB